VHNRDLGSVNAALGGGWSEREGSDGVVKITEVEVVRSFTILTQIIQ
jgi:hypothetical protein